MGLTGRSEPPPRSLVSSVCPVRKSPSQPTARPAEDAVYMYMGVSCPVRSLNMAAGMVFMWIWQ